VERAARLAIVTGIDAIDAAERREGWGKGNGK
jgi:hypothetical protein